MQCLSLFPCIGLGVIVYGYDDASLVLHVNAAIITDSYWIRNHDGNLPCKDIAFRKNKFDGLALYGDPDSFSMAMLPRRNLSSYTVYHILWSTYL